MKPIAFKSDGDASAPAIVLGHSLGSDWQVWDEVARELRDEWRVIRWDLPGHGRSAIPSDPPSIERTADLVVAGLTELGVESFHVGGISLGGMISLAIAQRHPGKVRSLAMFDSLGALRPPEQWQARAAQVRATGMEPLLEGTMERWFSPEFMEGKHASRYLRTAETFADCDPEGYAYCAEIIANADLNPGARTVTMPTLLVTGEDDAGATPKQVADLAARIPGAEGSVSVIKGARHMTCLEKPQLVSAELVQHLCAAL